MLFLGSTDPLPLMLQGPVGTLAYRLVRQENLLVWRESSLLKSCMLFREEYIHFQWTFGYADFSQFWLKLSTIMIVQ